MSSEQGAAPRAADLRIAISGKSGCGNTTVSRLVAARLGLRVVNYTFKDLARERGISFTELARLADEDPQYDLTIDRRQVQLAEKGGCVLGSRLAIWLLRETAFTIYLRAPLLVRAERIARREGWDVAAAVMDTEDRDRRDRDRYLRLYGYDVDVFDFASLVIDTDTMTQEQEADLIVSRATGKAGVP